MAVSGSVVVVDLNQPILMPARIKQISIGNLRDGIPMGPIVRIGGEIVRRTGEGGATRFAENRFAGDIQMVERIPGPHDIELLIENNDHISDDIDRTCALHVRENLFDVGEGRNAATG